MSASLTKRTRRKASKTVDKTPQVGVIMGSASDLDKVKAVFETLDLFKVPYETAVISAHRTPALVTQYAESAKERGVAVIIAAAGLAAALPGAMAALVDIPVIGLPLGGGPVSGVDALLSVTDMPPGVPVASVGIDSAKNAALLALRVVGLLDGRVQSELCELRRRSFKEVSEKSKVLRDKGLPVWEP
jgi:5-(carboxyamino)imidazole ribonucleotide mutase